MSKGRCAMNSIKYLLDTNFTIGVLKTTPVVATFANQHAIVVGVWPESAIARMVLLGEPPHFC